MALETFFITPAKNSTGPVQYAAAKISILGPGGEVVAGGVTAIFDTGAQGSVIDSDIAASAGLQPFREVPITRSGVMGVSKVYQVYFDLDGAPYPLYVVEGPFAKSLQNYSALIGMDVISKFFSFSINFVTRSIELHRG